MRRHGITALLTLALGVSACGYYDDYRYADGNRGTRSAHADIGTASARPAATGARAGY